MTHPDPPRGFAEKEFEERVESAQNLMQEMLFQHSYYVQKLKLDTLRASTLLFGRVRLDHGF